MAIVMFIILLFRHRLFTYLNYIAYGVVGRFAYTVWGSGAMTAGG